MVKAQDAIGIIQTLSENGIQLWLTGGWGIDALLGEQTRPHKDLDIIMLVDDVVRLRALLGRHGYAFKMVWSENRWAVDAQGDEIPTAFVLQDPEGREVDAHAMHLDDGGNGIPAWVNGTGLVFRSEDLAGEGVIDGREVRCLTPEMQLVCHTGYELPEVQLQDVERLQERFGIAYPDERSARW